MPPLLIAYPVIDPVLVDIGPLPIRWYALAYIGGLVGGWAAARFLVARERLWGGRAHASVLSIDDLVVYIAVGIIAGGRLGYILFYNLPFYLANPLEMLVVWRGGMAFHGGLVGAALAIALFARRRGLPVLSVADTVAPVVPIGLCLGRVANFIKPELWGRVTDAPWAMVFPGSDGQPRHPSQLYEAGLEGVALLILLWIVIARGGLQARGARHRPVLHRLRRRAGRLRVLPRARSAARLPVRRRHHGHAAVAAAHSRRRAAAFEGAAPRGRDGLRVNALGEELALLIAQEGPLSVERFMILALQHPRHGYYTTRNPFGRAGDFVTAPDVSQMFGELVGLWAAQVWLALGAPPAFSLVELGPGRGTMIADALRATRAVPGFRDAADVHLVETSPVLRAAQAETLRASGARPTWHGMVETLPGGPAIVLANEFFDALPVRHYVRGRAGWHERQVGLGADGRLAFGAAGEPVAVAAPHAAPGTMLEVGHAAMAATAQLARRIALEGGALLALDYGHARSAFGETLQAMRGHAFVDPLDAPGEADLTTHVDFAALRSAAEDAGARAWGPVPQGVWLERLGIRARAAALTARATSAQAEAIAAALARLTAPTSSMATLFKAFAVTQAGAAPPGFEDISCS